MEHVAGYCMVTDVRAGGGGNFDTFAPMGPWLATLDELPTQEVVPALVAYVSKQMSLQAGDVIVSNMAPSQWSPQLPLWFEPGRHVRFAFGELGEQQLMAVQAD